MICGNLKLLSLNPVDLHSVVQNIKSYNLDFDDAYQLTCANKYNLTLVSFDTDFDRSSIERKVPSELIS